MDRRSIMSLLIGITLFLSTWHIMLQQQVQYYDSPLPTNIIITPSASLLTNESAFYESPDAVFAQENLDNLPKNDFSQLIDLNDFKFLMNTKTCKDLNQPPLVVILIHSAPHNYNKRQTIRSTWGFKDSRSLMRFFVGNIVNSTSLQNKINLENDIYGDIVQGNFNDAYRNLTYKHVMVLKWYVYFCPNAKYLLKTDDDVLINSPLLYDVLETPTSAFSQLHQNRTIFCLKNEEVRVKRTFRSKWRVSFKEYSDKYYPAFCPGYVVLYTSDIVQPLYRTAQKLPYFWIDDVHITGTTAIKSNISVETPRNAFQWDLSAIKSNQTFLFSGPNIDETAIRQGWKIIQETRIDQMGNNIIEYDKETVPK